MTTDAYITIAILTATFGLLIKTKIPPPAVFLGALTMAISFELAPLAHLLKGFRNPGMLTVGVLFMVAAGMYATGAITMIMDKVIGQPKKLVPAKLKILPPIAVGSAFLNNTPLVAMMIPVIQDLSRRCRLPAKQLYIPLSFASILGGTCTLIGTSTNLVIGGLIIDAINKNTDLPAIRMVKIFDPALVAVPIAIVGIAIMVLFGKFLLPKESGEEVEQVVQRTYRAKFEVNEKSRIIGKTLEDSGILGIPGVELLVFRRGNKTIEDADDIGELQQGDTLSFAVTRDGLLDLWRTNDLRPRIRAGKMETEHHTHVLVKAVVARKNRAVGRFISELPLKTTKYKYNVVAVSQDGEAIKGPVPVHRIAPGDTLVLEVNDSFFYDATTEQQFTLTKSLDGYYVQRTNRAAAAIMITLTMISVVALGWMNMLNAGLLASGAMLMTGCLDFRKAAASIDWGTLIVIACAIGLESAVTSSGLARQLSALITSIGGDNPYMALTVIFLGCTFMTNVITNNAAAAFMFPIALATAYQMNLNFMPFAITLMVANSCAFITPTGYQTNLMIWGPGNYAFNDFVKIGIPMTILVGVMTIFLAPLMFGF